MCLRKWGFVYENVKWETVFTDDTDIFYSNLDMFGVNKRQKSKHKNHPTQTPINNVPSLEMKSGSLQAP